MFSPDLGSTLQFTEARSTGTRPSQTKTEAEYISGLTIRWASTWTEITELLRSRPNQSEYIPWCKKIRDLVFNATDIHLALSKEGFESSLVISSELMTVLKDWEDNALAWGFNPGCWSSLIKTAGREPTREHSGNQGTIMTASNLGTGEITEVEMEETMESFVNDQIWGPATDPSNIPSPRFTGQDGHEAYGRRLYERLQRARADIKMLNDRKQALLCEREELNAIISKSLEELEQLAFQ